MCTLFLSETPIRVECVLLPLIFYYTIILRRMQGLGEPVPRHAGGLTFFALCGIIQIKGNTAQSPPVGFA